MGQCGSSEAAAAPANTAPQTASKPATKEPEKQANATPPEKTEPAETQPAQTEENAESKPAEDTAPAKPPEQANDKPAEDAGPTNDKPEGDEPAEANTQEEEVKAEEEPETQDNAEPETAAAADDEAPAEEGQDEMPEITQRPSVAAHEEPTAARSITITERPFGFGAMNGPQFIGAQITSIKATDKWQNTDKPEQWLKSGQYLSHIGSSTANSGAGGEEDVRYATWRDISKKLKLYELPIIFKFWAGPEVENAWEAAFAEADISPDGKITWEEFQGFSENFAGEIGCDQNFLHEEFDRYAKDQNGEPHDYLDVDTFKLAVSHIKNDWQAHKDNPDQTKEKLKNKDNPDTKTE